MKPLKSLPTTIPAQETTPIPTTSTTPVPTTTTKTTPPTTPLQTTTTTASGTNELAYMDIEHETATIGLQICQNIKTWTAKRVGSMYVIDATML